MKTKIAIVLATAALVCMIGFTFAASFLYPMSSSVARNVVLENMNGVVLDPNSLTVNEPVYEGYAMQFQLLNIGKADATVTLTVVNPVGAQITLDSAHQIPFIIPINGTATFTLSFLNINATVSTVSWNIGLNYP